MRMRIRMCMHAYACGTVDVHLHVHMGVPVSVSVYVYVHPCIWGLNKIPFVWKSRFGKILHEKKPYANLAPNLRGVSATVR